MSDNAIAGQILLTENKQLRAEIARLTTALASAEAKLKAQEEAALDLIAEEQAKSSALEARLVVVMNAAKAFDADLSTDCDGPTRDALRSALASSLPIESWSDVISAADALQGAEAKYRMLHDVAGGFNMKTGQAWDEMRRAGNKVREALDRLRSARGSNPLNPKETGK